MPLKFRSTNTIEQLLFAILFHVFTFILTVIIRNLYLLWDVLYLLFEVIENTYDVHKLLSTLGVQLGCERERILSVYQIAQEECAC